MIRLPAYFLNNDPLEYERSILPLSLLPCGIRPRLSIDLGWIFSEQKTVDFSPILIHVRYHEDDRESILQSTPTRLSRCDKIYDIFTNDFSAFIVRTHHFINKHYTTYPEYGFVRMQITDILDDTPHATYYTA